MANYVDLISRVFTDFDNIYGKLVDKQVPLDNGTVLTSAMMSDGSVPTNIYASLVDKLVYIPGKGSLDTVAVITEATAATSSIKASATAGKYEVTLSALASTSYGYYDNGTSIKSTINVEDKTIADFTTVTNVPVEGDSTKTIPTYIVTPSSGKLISSITLEKGHAKFSFASNAFVNGETLTIDKTNAITNTSAIAMSIDSHTFGAGNVYSFDFTPKVTHGGTITVTPTIDKKLGLFTEDTDITSETGTYDFSKLDPTTLGKTTFYIKKGSVEIEKTENNVGNASINAHSDLDFLTLNKNGKVDTADGEVDPDDLGYSLEAAVADISLTGKFSEGYVKESNNLDLGNISVNSQTKYLKKGSVAAYTNNDVPLYSNLSGLSAVKEEAPTSGEYHTISVSLGTQGSPVVTAKGSIASGYVKDTQYDVTLKGSKNIYIKKGEYSLAPTIAASASATSMTLSASEIAGGYEIKVTPSLTLPEGTVTAGYISSKDQIKITAPAANAGQKSYWLSAATVNVEQAVRAVYHENTTDGKGEAIENNTPVDIFLNSAPANRDYYTINPIVSATATPGYLPGASVITGMTAPNETTDVIANVTKYLPKADLKWQVADDGSTSYLEVLQGGYLPSGLISEIDSDSAPSMATVGLTIGTGSTSGIFSQTAIAGGYKLTVGKGNVRAGYISSKNEIKDGDGNVTQKAEGTLTNTDFYIKKGTAGMTATPDDFTETEVFVPVTEEKTIDGVTKTVTTGYTLTATGSVTSTLNFTEGYIEGKDVSLNDKVYAAEGNDKLVTDVTYTKTINKASIGLAEGTSKISLSIDASAIETTNDVNDFVITPTLSGSSKVTIATTSAGYLSTNDSTEVEIVADNNTLNPDPIYIKAGQGGSISVSAASALGIKATPDFKETVSEGDNKGKYAVTVAGQISPSVDIDTGYYAETTKDSGKHTLSNTITVTGTTAYIDKAVAASEISVETKVSGTGIVFIEKDTSVNEGQYVEITALAPTVNNSVNITTAGYIKSGEVTAATLDNKNLTVVAESRKIALLQASECTKTIGGDNATVTSDTKAPSITIETANKYVNQDITVSLTEHAMGTGVARKLLDLEARLAGTYTAPVAGT